jgi:glycosyltransferase involved in cell wall biosynthesis
VWDVRGFWREDRLAIGMLRAGSAPERVLRAVESAAARSSGSIVILSQAAADVLARRFGEELREKCWVITTCVDLERFPLSPPPAASPLRLLLAGSLGGLYDVPLMLQLLQRLQHRRTTQLTVLTPTATQWDDEFRAHGAVLGHAVPAEMPAHVREHHVGLSVRLLDVGVTGYSATPTKVGEFLACGRPVLVNAGLGDLDTLLPKHDAGVIVRSRSDDELDRVVDEIERLVDDPETPRRCRALAEEHFDVDRGVQKLVEAYRTAVS